LRCDGGVADNGRPLGKGGWQEFSRPESTERPPSSVRRPDPAAGAGALTEGRQSCKTVTVITGLAAQRDSEASGSCSKAASRPPPASGATLKQGQIGKLRLNITPSRAGRTLSQEAFGQSRPALTWGIGVESAQGRERPGRPSRPRISARLRQSQAVMGPSSSRKVFRQLADLRDPRS